ncbi:MAG: sporulation protein YunB [Bacilli bacterium]|nr:sporulation protein YunB [Bacilli bacterium]
MMKKIKLKKRINKLNLLSISLVLIIICISLIFKFINIKASPIIMDYATLEAKKLSSIIINKAISKHITEKVSAEELFEITKDSNGEIKSIDYNSAIINKFLTETTNSVQINLQNIEKGEIEGLEFSDAILVDYDQKKLEKGIIYEISSGVLLGNPILANVGPKIPVKISLVGDAISNITTDIKNYGINNALIEVNVNIKMNEKIILPFYSELITVETKVPIAIKIITGSVPKYYGGALSQTTPSVVIPAED